MGERNPQRAPTGPAWRAPSLILVAIAAGLLAGLAESAFLAAQRGIAGRMVFMGRHAWWMTPIAEALLFAGVTALFLALSRPWPRVRTLRGVAFLNTGLAALALLLLVPPLHMLARVALAVGVGWQASRLVDALFRKREHVARRIAWGLAAGTAAIALVSAGITGIRDRPVGPAPAGDAPDVLLLILDTVRARSLSLYGYGRPTTPRLEALGRDGVVYERAIAPAPWTLPSHAAMFTGRPAHELSASWRRPLDDAHETVAERFTRAGYRTAGFVANMGYAGWETGLDRGFQRYEDHPISLRQLVVESSLARRIVGSTRFRDLRGTDENFVRKSAARVNERFLGWLDRGDEERPYFAFLNYYDAHAPYEPPEPYRTRFARGEPRGAVSALHRWNENPFAPPPDSAAIARELDAYEAAIAYVDAEIGRLVEELERRGRLDRTVIVVASDHGEEFGEHGVYDHGNSLYFDGVHVPLLVRYPPRVPAGTRVETPVSLRHVAATLADLAGLEGPPLPGRSLAGPPGSPDGAPVLTEVSFAPRLPDWFPVSRGDMASLIDERWQYIRNGDGVEEFYDLDEDPGERRDLAADPARGADIARYRGGLPAHRGDRTAARSPR